MEPVYDTVITAARLLWLAEGLKFKVSGVEHVPAEGPGVVAIKIAPFNRYQTIDVVRAVCHSPRCDDIALYTGNDDNIVNDLLTVYRFSVNGRTVEKRIVGGLLGHWAVWTKKAVELLEEIKRVRAEERISREWYTRNIEVTDANLTLEGLRILYERNVT